MLLNSCRDEMMVSLPKEKPAPAVQMKVSPDTIVISSVPTPVRSPDPATRIEFTIPVQAHVKLVVYADDNSSLGTLIDAVLDPGIYAVSWSASNLASGVYYFQLNVGGSIQVKKLVLVK